MDPRIEPAEFDEGGFFNDLGAVIVPRLQSVYRRRDLVLLSSRVALEVARKLNRHLDYRTVQVMGFNALFVERMSQTGDFPPDEEEAKSWYAAGAHSVAIGFGKGSDRKDIPWNGHMVVVGRTHLLDLGLAVMNRPEKGIYTEDWMVHPLGDFKREGRETYPLSKNGRIIYWRDYSAGFSTLPEWTAPGLREPFIQEAYANLSGRWAAA